MRRDNDEKGSDSHVPELLETLPAEPPKPLTPYQQQVAVFLAANGYTHGVRSPRNLIARAASLVGYSRHTIYYWMKNPEFMRAIETLQAQGDTASSRGWALLLEGDAARGIKPEIAAIMAWKKSRFPEVFDERHRRDEAKRKHEKEMFLLKCEQERRVAEQKHRHDKKLVELRAKLGVQSPEERPMPAFVYIVEPPSEIPDFEAEEPTEH